MAHAIQLRLKTQIYSLTVFRYGGPRMSVYLYPEDDGRRHNFNPLSAGDAFKRIHTVFPQLKSD